MDSPSCLPQSGYHVLEDQSLIALNYPSRVLEYYLVMASLILGIGGAGITGLGSHHIDHQLDGVMVQHMRRSMVQDQWPVKKCMDSLFRHLFRCHRPALTYILDLPSIFPE